MLEVNLFFTLTPIVMLSYIPEPQAFTTKGEGVEYVVRGLDLQNDS